MFSGSSQIDTMPPKFARATDGGYKDVERVRYAVDDRSMETPQTTPHRPKVKKQVWGILETRDPKKSRKCATADCPFKGKSI